MQYALFFIVKAEYNFLKAANRKERTMPRGIVRKNSDPEYVRIAGQPVANIDYTGRPLLTSWTGFLFFVDRILSAVAEVSGYITTQRGKRCLP